MNGEPDCAVCARGVAPDLADSDRAWRGFSWQRACERLEGLPGHRGLDVAHGAVDRLWGRP